MLRSERRRLGLTQVRVAERAQVSPETIRKYENGTRTPARASLERVIEALEIPQSLARSILRAAGFDAPEERFSNADYFFTVDELRGFVERVPWPQFVANNLAEIVAANRAAQALWGIDFPAEIGRRPRARLNFLSIVAEKHFSQRVVNWDEAVGTLVGVLKAIPQFGESLDPPGALFRSAIDEFIANDPGAIPGLLALWEATPPQPAKVRWNYRIVWRDPDAGEIRFLGIVTTASEPDALAFNDWIPLDADSAERFERVVATHRPSSGAHGREGR